MLFAAGLVQHVTQPTLVSGHILDVIITRESESIVHHVDVDNPLISDHSAVHFQLDVTPLPPQQREVIYRKFSDIDIDKWRSDVHTAFSETPCKLSADQCASSYAEKLSDLLEKHAPETKKVLTIKSFSPWITDEVHDAIQLRRCAERKWRHTHLTIH